MKKWKSLYIQKVILNIADTTSKNLIFEKRLYQIIEREPLV